MNDSEIAFRDELRQWKSVPPILQCDGYDVSQVAPNELVTRLRIGVVLPLLAELQLVLSCKLRQLLDHRHVSGERGIEFVGHVVALVFSGTSKYAIVAYRASMNQPRAWVFHGAAIWPGYSQMRTFLPTYARNQCAVSPPHPQIGTWPAERLTSVRVLHALNADSMKLPEFRFQGD